MHIYFRPTSLFNTLVMLILFVGGLGPDRAGFELTFREID